MKRKSISSLEDFCDDSPVLFTICILSASFLAGVAVASLIKVFF